MIELGPGGSGRLVKLVEKVALHRMIQYEEVEYCTGHWNLVAVNTLARQRC